MELSASARATRLRLLSWKGTLISHGRKAA
jgi:hypothetical protein